ncbi:MAG: hypothetical protein C0490_15930 [Marivirga sp.]|nr:hypothetical protein [Marivirga sp.]
MTSDYKTNEVLLERSSGSKLLAARLSITAAAISIVALLSLHILSPEFGPSWRMVSEYANGRFEWVLFIFFTFWGISSWCVTCVLWSYVSTIASKAGVFLLFVSGLGEILAAFFNVNHPQHGTTGTLGIPTFVMASLLISYHLKNKPEWNESKRTLLWSAHASWISLVLVVITMIVMISGFKNAGIAIGPDQKPPSSVPDGVVAVVGYANRILIAAYIYWLVFVAYKYINILKSKT